MIGLVGCVGLDDANDMMDAIYSVIGNGLKYIKELLFQGKEGVVIWLANKGRLGVESIRSFMMSDRKLIPFSWVRNVDQKA